MSLSSRALHWMGRLATKRGSRSVARHTAPAPQALASSKTRSPSGQEDGTRHTPQWPAWLLRIAAVLAQLLPLARTQSASRRLRFVERVTLGDKQFVALLELDGVCFLASGSPAAVALTPAHAFISSKPKRAQQPSSSAATERAQKCGLGRGAARRVATAHRTQSAQRPVAMFANLAGPHAPTQVPLETASQGAPGATPELSSITEPEADDFSNFSALLELRMLATEVFAEPASPPEGSSASSRRSENATIATPPPQTAPPRVPPPPEPSSVASLPPVPAPLLHSSRRRISSYACLAVLLLVPHARAHALAASSSAGRPTATYSLLANRLAVGELMTDPAPLALALYRVASTTAAAPDELKISGLNSLGGSSASWGIVVLLTLLTLIPSLLICVTPFARLLIVFHFLRQALGLQTTPSNQTLIGLSMILTFFLMQPVGETIYREAVLPVQAGKLTPLDGVIRAGDPLRHFMARYVREKDAELFLSIAKEPRPHSIDGLSFRVLLPAYILSELKAGFQIGTVLFLPFLIVDMVVASITTSVGMVQLPPVVISTPLKLLLFLMVDGWHLLIDALMRSFR